MADSESVSTAYQRYSLNLPKKEKNENFVKKDKHQKNPQNLKKEYVNYQPIPKQLWVMANVLHIWLLAIYGVTGMHQALKHWS